MYLVFDFSDLLNTLRPTQNGRHFADEIFKCIFLNENEWISLKLSLKFVLKGPMNNIPALVQIIAWRRPGDKPLSEPTMVSLPNHICFARPQWVKAVPLVLGRSDNRPSSCKITLYDTSKIYWVWDQGNSWQNANSIYTLWDILFNMGKTFIKHGQHCPRLLFLFADSTRPKPYRKQYNFIVYTLRWHQLKDILPVIHVARPKSNILLLLCSRCQSRWIIFLPINTLSIFNFTA